MLRLDLMAPAAHVPAFAHAEAVQLVIAAEDGKDEAQARVGAGFQERGAQLGG